MENLEILKKEVDVEYKKYKSLYTEVRNSRDMIEGSLNRICVSDSESEVDRLYDYLISFSLNKYKELARKCHKQYLIYNKKFIEYYNKKEYGV